MADREARQDRQPNVVAAGPAGVAVAEAARTARDAVGARIAAADRNTCHRGLPEADPDRTHPDHRGVVRTDHRHRRHTAVAANYPAVAAMSSSDPYSPNNTNKPINHKEISGLGSGRA